MATNENLAESRNTNVSIETALEKLIEKSKSKGMLTVEDVDSAIVVACGGTKKQLKDAFEYLQNKHILIIDKNDNIEEELVDEQNFQSIDSVQHYLSSIGKIPLLTAEEEVELSRKIQNGDKDAENKLVTSNIRLVVSIAKRFTNRGLDFDDLIQSGSMGVIIAAKKFDPEKGFRFSTYATWWIKQAVSRAVAEGANTIHIPSYVKEIMDKMSRISIKYEQEYGDMPSAEYLAEALNIDVKKIQHYQKLKQKNLSIFESIGEEGGDSILLDIIEDTNGNTPEKEAEKESDREAIRKAVSSLRPTEQMVINLRFGLNDGVPRKLEEIGLLFNITRERVRQIEQKALKKLRSPARSIEIKKINRQ